MQCLLDWTSRLKATPNRSVVVCTVCFKFWAWKTIVLLLGILRIIVLLWRFPSWVEPAFPIFIIIYIHVDLATSLKYHSKDSKVCKDFFFSDLKLLNSSKLRGVPCKSPSEKIETNVVWGDSYTSIIFYYNIWYSMLVSVQSILYLESISILYLPVHLQYTLENIYIYRVIALFRHFQL